MSKRSSLRNRKGMTGCWRFAATAPVNVLAALLCLVLLFFSITLVVMQSSAAQASNMVAQLPATATSPVGGTPSPTITSTPSPTPSPSPTLSPSPTPSPSPSPTRTPRPTRTPKPDPTPSPTATVAPITTGTAQPTATLQPTATRNPNATSTPTTVPVSGTTGNGGGTGLPPSTPTPPTTQGRGGGGSFLLPVIIGLLATLAIAGACVLGFVVLRRRMLPVDPLRTNLPPSGARPWSRFRQGSMHGGTNMYNQQTLADTTPPVGGAATWAISMNGTEQGMNFAQSSRPVPFTQAQAQRGFSSSLPVFPQSQPYPQVPPNGGFSQSQPYPQVPPNRGFPQSQPFPSVTPNGGYPAREPLFPQQPFPQQDFPPARPSAGFYPTNIGNNDIALAPNAADTPSTGMGNMGQHTSLPVHLHRIDGMDSSRTGDVPAMPGIPGMPDLPDTPRPLQGPETNSEEFPLLDDPFLRNTLKHYMQKGKSAQEGEQSNEG